jgi:pSer/pThr/pTyr-binding forkhead associated (FHA) protein
MAKLFLLNGPEKGRSFKLREGISFVGRSLDNDIQIEEKTVSRKHLRIMLKGDNYFITDLKSRNGTFLDGVSVEPGHPIEVEEGVPIGIGKCLLCIGKGDLNKANTFMDTMELRREAVVKDSTLSEERAETDREKLQFLYEVSNILSRGLPTKKTLEKILGQIFDLLKRIERGAFILVDPHTRQITEVISKSDKPSGKRTRGYSRRIANRVIETGNPIVISNVRTEENTELVDTLEVLKIECVLCVPMVLRSQIIGAIYVDSRRRPHGFREDDLYLFMDLGQRIALAIENEQFSSEISRIAEILTHDN